MKSARTLALSMCIGLLLAIPVAGQESTSQSKSVRDVKSTGLEEVVVTARRRRESLQDTPIAVTALTGEDLRERGITGIGELTKSVPSVEILESTSNVIYIRGIGQRSAYARVDPTVGVYLDNIFLPRADGQLMDTVDVENVQVLRGPQGTLFGKNTTGGAMVLTLEKPGDDKEGYVMGGLGNYGRQQLRTAYNVPLTDTLFSRFSLSYLKDDGYFKDRSQGESNASRGRISGIAQLRWEASEDVLIDSLLYAGKINERLPGIVCTPINLDNAVLVRGLYLLWEGDTDPANPTAYEENCRNNSRERLGDLRSNMGPDSYMDRKLDTYLAATTIDWALSEDLALKFVISARDEWIGPIISADQDGGPMNFSESFNTQGGDRASYSFEVQLNGQSADGDWQYTGGVFAMKETNTEEFALTNALNGVDSETLAALGRGERPGQPPPGGTQPLVGILVDPVVRSNFGLENQTLAAFFQSSWQMTEAIELTLGIRWTEETRQSDLIVTGSDREAIGQTIALSGLGFGPAAEGFNPYLGPTRWAADPIGLAMSLFPDANGDGINDFPSAATPIREDEEERIFRKLTPMMSLSYQFQEANLPDVVDSLMVYGTWSSGFKSGFFEPKGVDGLTKIEPEEVENREIGFKLEAFQRSIRINMAVYDMEFNNQQLIQADADSATNLVVVYQNAAESSIRGGEIEIQWMPYPGFLLNASMSRNEYKYVAFDDNDLLQAALGNDAPVDRSGEPFPISPETTFALGVQWTLDSQWGPVTPRLDYSYKSDIYYGLDPGAHDVYREKTGNAGQPAYGLVDFRLTWALQEQRTTVTGYIKNVLDKRYDIGIAAVADSTATYFQAYGDPRRFGLEIRREF